MDLEVFENEIKTIVKFYEVSYETKIWDFLDIDLHDFLVTNRVRFFQDKDPVLFRKCMLNYFDYLINEVMCDNHLIINKEFIFNNLFYLQVIFDGLGVNEDVYESSDDLKLIFNIDDKTLTKHI